MATTVDEEKQKVMTFWQTFFAKEAYKEHYSISSQMHQAILSSVHPNKKYFTSNELLKLRNFISKQRIYFIYLNFMARTFPKEFYDQDLSPTKRITA